MDACGEESTPAFLNALPVPLLWVMLFGCLGMAAFASGMTLGLMSLDSIQIEVLEKSGTEETRKLAGRIRPLRAMGNQLLVTLLLTNSLAAELLPLVMDTLLPGGVLSLVLSVFSIMLFGEILPQSVCSRYGLKIGGNLAGLVHLLIKLMSPIAYPVGKALDLMLGHEMGRPYRRDELKGLIECHSRSKYGMLTEEETGILQATLEFGTKTVAQCMTKEVNCFMLDIDGTLDYETLKKILRSGHSRIPLYEGKKSNVLGLLMIKQLLLIDPKDNVPIRVVVSRQHGSRKQRVGPVLATGCNTSLIDMLNEFQTGRSHMALVYDDVSKPPKKRKLLGLVTLEDIVEEILQEEIVDETDVYVSNENDSMPVYRRGCDGKLHRTLVRATQVAKGDMEYRPLDRNAILSSRSSSLDSFRSASRTENLHASLGTQPSARRSSRVMRLKLPKHLMSEDEAESDEDDTYPSPQPNMKRSASDYAARKETVSTPTREDLEAQLNENAGSSFTQGKQTRLSFEIPDMDTSCHADDARLQESKSDESVDAERTGDLASDNRETEPHALNDSSPRSAPVDLDYHVHESEASPNSSRSLGDVEMSFSPRSSSRGSVKPIYDEDLD
ncbi:Metal transporter CNNM2 [Porphyridium purpureum]|uniref:Metal transporter CNNM2 n=1 Tax=Porphyridium purpureum TaxID=35688 RepID=A0A5J4YNM9_PORPP|nr:Metal transporter CNNM2 [Porphyridium purpureum]|eukprot:POR8635..scf222_8